MKTYKIGHMTNKYYIDLIKRLLITKSCFEGTVPNRSLERRCGLIILTNRYYAGSKGVNPWSL